jgi:hypothetical protein
MPMPFIIRMGFVIQPKKCLHFLDEWETIDPTPDLHALFLEFNQEFFWGRLLRYGIFKGKIHKDPFTKHSGICLSSMEHP